LGALRCSFIVSAFDRPAHLDLLLRSLRLQTFQDFEVLVTDNAIGDRAFDNFRIVIAIGDSRFRYIEAGQADCYFSANLGAKHAHGEYLCFPSDDNYYVPRFLESTLKAAPADLIYCDCLYDGHGIHYAPMDVKPVCGWIDKGGFLVKREKFTGFAGPAVDRPADGWLIEALIKTGATHTKAPGYLWIHN
jgi:glycosyltransferase involved in cell wall biosynthesis